MTGPVWKRGDTEVKEPWHSKRRDEGLKGTGEPMAVPVLPSPPHERGYQITPTLGQRSHACFLPWGRWKVTM